MSLTAVNRRDWFLDLLQTALNSGEVFDVKKVYAPEKWTSADGQGASGFPKPIAYAAIANERIVPVGEATAGEKSECDFWITVAFQIEPDTDGKGVLDRTANTVICELLEPRLRSLVKATHSFPIERDRTEVVNIVDARATEIRAGFHDDKHKGVIQARGVIRFNYVIVRP